MTVAEKLKTARTQRGLTQKELGNAVHVSRSAVAKWENGLGLPSEGTAADLAAFFGVPKEEFFTEEVETVIVEQRGMLSRRKKWLIALICAVCALAVAVSAVLGVFFTREEATESVDDEMSGATGGNTPVVITGIYGAFVGAKYDYLYGYERTTVYHLKVGETYPFVVHLNHRGSQDVRIAKESIEVYFDETLFAFDAGEYFEDFTASFDFPFYFTPLAPCEMTTITACQDGKNVCYVTVEITEAQPEA